MGPCTCDQFSGRCLRRTSQSRVISCLISGCHSGLTWRIPQRGSSAIMQQISSSWVECRDVQTGQIQIVRGLFVRLLLLWFWMFETVQFIPIPMYISLALYSEAVHKLIIEHPFYFVFPSTHSSSKLSLSTRFFNQNYKKKIKRKVTFKASTTGYLSVCTSLGEDRILVHHHFLNKEVVFLWKVSQNEAKTTYQVCRLLFVVPRVVCLYAEHA